MIRENQDNASELSLSQRMAAAALAGTLSSSILLPLDAIRTRMHAHPSFSHSDNLTVRRAAKDLWRMGGVREFFRGFGVSFMRAGPVASLSMPAYDLALELFQRQKS